MAGFKLKANGAPSALPDMDQVRRALTIFLDFDNHVFLQTLPGASWACLHGKDVDQILTWIETNTRHATGTYFGINPTAKVDRPTRIADIVRRRWILIDIDRNKTLQPDDPATENEHEDAKELAFEIMSYLSEVGLPAPIQVDSGNGFHLYYRIDMPNDDTHRDLVHEFLKVLDHTFSGDKGKVGHEVFDARRISRMPGTWSRRGAASKERPYRQCKLMYYPKDVGVVPTELLRRIVDDSAKHEQETAAVPAASPAHEASPKDGFTLTVKATDRNRAYGKVAIDQESAKLALCPKGNRNNQLFKSACALWELCNGGCLTGQEVKDALWIAAKQCELGDDEIAKTIESARKKTENESRQPPEDGARLPKASTAKNENASPPPLDATKRIITLASEITPRQIQWLWQGRIPLGMMTTFAGSGGLGKTFVLTDIAARVSRGDVWPDGAKGNTPGKVLYVSGEDNADDTLVPRLIAAGGDRENVAYFKPEALGQFSLERLDLLDMALDQLGGQCQLVCIDPPTSFLAGTDDHKNSELRELLTPLSEWASRRRVAIVFITHVNKGGAGKVDAVMRIIGSVAWSTAVRAAHMFCADPDDPEKCLFLVAKINGAKKRKGIAYRIHQIDPEETDGLARVEWLGEVDTTANEAMAGQTKVMKRGEAAAEWMVEKFREKLEWQSNELFNEAQNNGFKEGSLWEAKKILNLPKAKKTILPNGTVAWCWWVPADWEGFNTADQVGVPEKKSEHLNTWTEDEY